MTPSIKSAALYWLLQQSEMSLQSLRFIQHINHKWVACHIPHKHTKLVPFYTYVNVLPVLDPSSRYCCALLEQPLCSPINLILAVGQGGTAVVRGDVLKLHLHQHIHLEEINGAVGVPVSLLQGHLAVLGAHVGQLRLDECYLLCKLELCKGGEVEKEVQATYMQLVD